MYLPVEPELKPFGYDLFTMVPTTFAPGDRHPGAVRLCGRSRRHDRAAAHRRLRGLYPLAVGRDGAVDFPELGPIARCRPELRRRQGPIEQQVPSQMIGTRASVSMGALRSIQVFVLGEAERPGSYTVSGLSTITNALFASGGVREIGSLAHDPAEAQRQARAPARPVRPAAARRYEPAMRGCCRATSSSSRRSARRSR